MTEKLEDNAQPVDTQPGTSVAPTGSMMVRHAAEAQSAPRSPTQRATFYCTVCNRAAGPELFVCEPRKRGFCPYRFRRSPHPKRRRGIVTIVIASFVLLAAVAAALYAALNGLVPLFWGSLVAIVIALILGMQGAYRVLWVQELLINSQTRVRWLRRQVLNMPLYRQVVTGLNPFFVPQANQTYYPASIAAHYGTLSMPVAQRAVHLIEVAIFGLMARGLLQLHKTNLYEAAMGQAIKPVTKNTLTVSPGQYSEHAGGELERRMLDIVARHYRNPLQTDDLPVYGLIKALYEQPVENPFETVLEWVQSDAINHRFAELTHGHFRFNDNATALNADGKLVLQIYSDFARNYTDTETVMAEEIHNAIESQRA